MRKARSPKVTGSRCVVIGFPERVKVEPLLGRFQAELAQACGVARGPQGDDLLAGSALPFDQLRERLDGQAIATVVFQAHQQVDRAFEQPGQQPRALRERRVNAEEIHAHLAPAVQRHAVAGNRQPLAVVQALAEQQRGRRVQFADLDQAQMRGPGFAQRRLKRSACLVCTSTFMVTCSPISASARHTSRLPRCAPTSICPRSPRSCPRNCAGSLISICSMRSLPFHTSSLSSNESAKAMNWPKTLLCVGRSSSRPLQAARRCWYSHALWRAVRPNRKKYSTMPYSNGLSRRRPRTLAATAVSFISQKLPRSSRSAQCLVRSLMPATVATESSARAPTCRKTAACAWPRCARCRETGESATSRRRGNAPGLAASASAGYARPGAPGCRNRNPCAYRCRPSSSALA